MDTPSCHCEACGAGRGNTGRLFDSTLTGGDYLDAVYVLGNNWTTIETIPEPGTVLLLGLGATFLRRKHGRK